MNSSKSKRIIFNFSIRPEIVITFFLTISILIVYWQVNHYGFTRYDDGLYLYENPHVQDGLTFKSVKWAFTTTYFANWHPLTWLSYLADITFYGMNPGQFHLTNVILHILNTLLLFYLLNYNTEKKSILSGIVAAFFALHPLHVESVAWISERKDLLCSFWGLSAFIFYSFFVKKQNLKWYLLALACFCLSLMSKPMLVTLPFLFLLWDYWPLKRVQFPIKRKSIRPNLKCHHETIGKVILEKLPFFILMILSIIVTLYAQQNANAVASLEMYSIHIRIANALVSYVNYIVKMFWPCCLAVFYPYPNAFPMWKVVGASLFLTILSLLAFVNVRSRPYLFVGWFWYLGMLAPVIGLVQVGSQARADRYTYLPLIGLFILVVWGLSELYAGKARLKTCILTFVGVILSSLIYVSYLQVKHWENDITLFQHALKVTQGNYVAHNNLGLALAAKGRLPEAIAHYSNALKISPTHKSAHNNWGIALAAQGQLDEAKRHFHAAIELDPHFGHAHNNLGYVLATQGQLDEAIRHYRLALDQDSFFSRARNNLAKALFLNGDVKAAIAQYTETLKRDPNNAVALNNLRILMNGQSK